MNTATKSFVLLLLWGGLLIAPLAFPALAAAQTSAETSRELDQARKVNAQLKARLAELEASLAKSQAMAANSQAQCDRLKAENEQLKRELTRVAQLASSRRGGTEPAGPTGASPQQQLDALRQQVRQLQADGEKNLKSVVELTEQLHKAFGELKRLKAENSRLSLLLPPPPPNGLEGTVTATQENSLVEISLGSDAGLKPGHQLSVHRAKGAQTGVLGQIMVVKTAPERAVCRADPDLLSGAVEKGDRVTTGKQPAQRATTTEPPRPGEPPLLVGGVVLAVLPEGQVEISFGTGDGLRPGHRLEVYRQTGKLGIYVGRVEVVETGPKKSRCRIISELDTVRQGDQITSKL